MKTPFVTAVLVAAVQGVLVDKSRSQWLADNAGAGYDEPVHVEPVVAVPTGHIEERALPSVNSGEVFYEGEDPYVVRGDEHVRSRVHDTPSPGYVEPVVVHEPVYHEPVVVKQAYVEPDPYHEPPIVHNHGKDVHVHEGGDEYHKHIVGDPVIADYHEPPVVHHIAEPAYVEPVVVHEPVYHEPVVVHEPVYHEPVVVQKPAYVEPVVVHKPAYVEPDPYHEPPVVHNHGKDVHVHEGGDEYHKHIVGDPVVAEYHEPPVVHHIAEPAYVEPVVVKPVIVEPPVIKAAPIVHVEPVPYVAPIAVKPIPIIAPKPAHKAKPDWLNDWMGSLKNEVPAPSLLSLEPVAKPETTGSYYSGYKRSW